MAKRMSGAYAVAFVGMMSAVVFVANYFSVPMLSSRIHIANAVCLLAGMLFGGVRGALAAGIGSALFDVVGQYGLGEAVITFVNKGLMALACGIIANDERNKIGRHAGVVLGAVAGAVLYIALYLFKSYIQMAYVAPLPPSVIPIRMGEKLLASSINGAFAVIAAPILYSVLKPALTKAGMYRRMS